jgi:hypothetical protein
LTHHRNIGRQEVNPPQRVWQNAGLKLASVLTDI